MVGSQFCSICEAGFAGIISNQIEIVEDLPYGWKRITGSFDITPQPDWENINWSFVTEAAGKAAIDNVYFGTHCTAVPEPSAIAFFVPGLLLILRRYKI